MSNELHDLEVVTDLVKGSNDVTAQYQTEIVPRLRKVAGELLKDNKSKQARIDELEAEEDKLRKSAAELENAAEKGAIPGEKRDALVRKLAADGHLHESEIDGTISRISKDPSVLVSITERLSDRLAKAAKEASDGKGPALVSRQESSVNLGVAKTAATMADLDAKYAAELAGRRG